LALRFGAAAVRMAEAQQFDHMVALAGGDMKSVPLEEAIKGRKKVNLDNDKIATAREIGICLGD
jgi:6-phosphofructokinase 1